MALSPDSLPLTLVMNTPSAAVRAPIDAGLGEQFAAASMIGKCDRPENVAVVADVTKRTLGYTVTPLALGGQI